MFTNLSRVERIQRLKDNADKIEIKGYMKPFDENQIGQYKDCLAETSIQLNDLAEEKKEFLAEIKEKVKPLESDRKKILKDIKQRSAFVEEQCYMFIDHDRGEVGYYNANGDLVDSRGIRPEERQKTVFQANTAFDDTRTGTNN